MHLGNKLPKIGSWTGRKFRLGVSHGGTPSSWIAPTKDTTQATERTNNKKKNRR